MKKRSTSEECNENNSEITLHIYFKSQKFKKTKHIGKDMEELEVPNSSVRIQKETTILDYSMC